MIALVDIVDDNTQKSKRMKLCCCCCCCYVVDMIVVAVDFAVDTKLNLSVSAVIGLPF